MWSANWLAPCLPHFQGKKGEKTCVRKHTRKRWLLTPWIHDVISISHFVCVRPFSCEREGGYFFVRPFACLRPSIFFFLLNFLPLSRSHFFAEERNHCPASPFSFPFNRKIAKRMKIVSFFSWLPFYISCGIFMVSAHECMISLWQKNLAEKRVEKNGILAISWYISENWQVYA